MCKEIATDFTVSDKFENKEKLPSWNNKSPNISNFTIFKDKEIIKETKKCWKKDDFISSKCKNNNSTLSLHIEAHENSIETAASNLFEKKKNNGFKNEIFTAASTHFIQNPFEFPRQQNDGVIEPEVSQFKASQHLINPNEASYKYQQRLQQQQRLPALPAPGFQHFQQISNFDEAHNRHHHQQQQPGEGHYEEEFYGDEYYMDVKHDQDAESVFDIEAEEDAAVSELEIQRNSATATNSRKYTFIQRPKAQTYVCEYCNKQLRYKSKYLEHLRIHTGERPFTCSFCEASFTQRGAMKQHERIHTGSKPHYCLTCNKSFRTASTLNIHLKTHSATDTVIAGFESALQDPIFEDHARIAEELAYEEAQQQQEKEDDEYFQVYEEPESNELTHRWHVNHITQTIVETTHVPPESELNLARFSDGRLQVNDTILEPEHFPMDGVTFYYYTLSNNEILTFMYDEGSNTLEIVETNDDNGVAGIEEEIPPHDTEIPHYEEEHFEDAAEGEYEVYEEVLPSGIVAQTSAAEYEAVFENDQQKAGLKDHPPTEYIIDPVPDVVDVEHMNELPVDNKELITVVAAPSNEMAPEMIAVNKAFYPPTRRKVYPPLHLIKRRQKPKNLEWIINAVAAGKKLEDATPHKRKKPTIKECEICGLTLKYPSKIAAHMRTHSGEKPFKCDICGRGFAMNTTLRMHIRRHLKEKEYRCTYPDCNKSFVNGALLNYHYQNRHLSRRKFACLRGCGTTFFSNKERERHEKVCIPSMVHEDADDDNLQYEEFVNPETGETEKWIFSGYSEESWDNNNMDNVVIEESGQISTIDEAHY